jgi:hypothetical protein
MNMFYYLPKKSHFFYKTLKSILKLFLNDNFSLDSIFVKINHSLDFFIKIIMKNVFKFMLRGKREILTIGDLQNSVSPIKDVQFLIFKKIKYEKPNNSLSFISKNYQKKKNLGKRKNYHSKQNKFFLIQQWYHFMENEKYKKKTKIGGQKIIIFKSFKKKLLNANLFSFSFSLLTDRQKLFFRYLISILEKDEKNEDDINEEEACLECLSNNPGLIPLIPYIFVFLNHFMLREKDSLLKTKLGIKVIKALFLNNSLKLEVFIQQILPILLKCVVSFFSEEIFLNEILSLKLYAANLIGYIVIKFQKKYLNIKSKLAFFFLKHFFNYEKSLLEIYGALIGLAGLGTKSIELYAIPNFPIVLFYIQKNFKKKDINLKKIRIIKKLLNFMIIMTTTYLIDNKINFFHENFSDFHEKNNIEEKFQILYKLKKLKKDIDNFFIKKNNFKRNKFENN